MQKTELLGKSSSELEEFAEEQGEPRFRGRQLFKWIYQKNMGSFYEMNDIPRELRFKLDKIAQISIPRVLKQRVAADGARKFLIELGDKKRIETVIIPQGDNKDTKHTICVSAQVGCPLQCVFCATGLSGFQRNLEAFEIVGQVLGSNRELMRRLKKKEPKLITNVVFMGMGEPMLNYREMLKSIHMINEPKGMNIGQRHITVSTAGHAEGIQALAAEKLQVTLAVSLHAARDELRDRLMPINKKYPLQHLMESVAEYIRQTGRRVTFEYVLLDEINMRSVDADDLIRLVKPLLANINLIPYNKVTEASYEPPSPYKVKRFYQKLVQAGLKVTIRHERGADIDAACGQLAAHMAARF